MSVTELHIGVILVRKDRLVQIVRIDKGAKMIVRDLVNNNRNIAFPLYKSQRVVIPHGLSARNIFAAALSASAREGSREWILTRMKHWPARYRTHFWPSKLGY